MTTYRVSRIFADGLIEDRDYTRLRDANRSLRFGGVGRPRGMVAATIVAVDDAGECTPVGGEHRYTLSAGEFGGLLREARGAADLTQAQAAHRIGRAANTVARWERGEIATDRLTQLAVLRTLCANRYKPHGIL